MIIMYLAIIYAHRFYYKHHTIMTMNRFFLNEHKQDT